MPDLLEPVTELEEVASSGETVGSEVVDLTMVSQQLDQVITWQEVQLGTQWVLIGVLIGVVIALVFRRFWR